jgi:hypothetical protein
MPGPRRTAERKRRRRAKVIVDFATGEVHDCALDAAADPRAIGQAQGEMPTDDEGAAFSPEELSNEDRAQLGADRPKGARRARIANQQSGRRWVKARKIP